MRQASWIVLTLPFLALLVAAAFYFGDKEPGDTVVNVNLDAEMAFGTATIAANGASIDVTHGMGGTPDAVVVTPMGDVGNSIWWVSNVGATTFRINLDPTLTATTTVAWLSVE